MFKFVKRVQKVRCLECGALILPDTAGRTGGKCMPCHLRPEREAEAAEFAAKAATRNVYRSDGAYHARALQVVWRALNEELNVPASKLSLHFDLKTFLKGDPQMRGRLLRRIESDIGIQVFDGIWRRASFTLPDLVDFYAETLRVNDL